MNNSQDSTQFYEEKDEYEDDQNISDDLLIPNKFLNTFSKNQNQVVYEFKNSLKNKYKFENKIILIMMMVYFIGQTLISIIVKDYIDYNMLIYSMRGIFSVMLIYLFFVLEKIYLSSLFKIQFIVIYSFGIICATIELYYMRVEEMKIAQLCETIFILIASSNNRYVFFFYQQ